MGKPQSRPEAKLLSSRAGRSGATSGPQNACKPSRKRQRGHERTRQSRQSLTLKGGYIPCAGWASAHRPTIMSAAFAALSEAPVRYDEGERCSTTSSNPSGVSSGFEQYKSAPVIRRRRASLEWANGYFETSFVPGRCSRRRRFQPLALWLVETGHQRIHGTTHQVRPSEAIFENG